MKNKSGFSKISLEIYNCIKNEYSGIAETGNIQYSMSLSPRQIGNYLRPLIKTGYILCVAGGCTMEKQYGGSYYKIVKNL